MGWLADAASVRIHLVTEPSPVSHSRSVRRASVLVFSIWLSSCSGEPFQAVEGERYRYGNAAGAKEIVIQVFPSKNFAITHGLKIGPDEMNVVDTQPISYKHGMFRYADMIVLPRDFKSKIYWYDQGVTCSRALTESATGQSNVVCKSGNEGVNFIFDDRKGVVEMTPVCSDCIPETLFLISRTGLAHPG